MISLEFYLYIVTTYGEETANKILDQSIPDKAIWSQEIPVDVRKNIEDKLHKKDK